MQIYWDITGISWALLGFNQPQMCRKNGISGGKSSISEMILVAPEKKLIMLETK